MPWEATRRSSSSTTRDEGRLAAANRFAIHHPLLGIASRKRQPGRFDRRQDLRPKDLGQSLVVEQIAPFGLASRLGSPLLLLTVDHCRRHDEMDMRVIIQPARVRVQHRSGTRRPLKRFVVLAEGTHRLPATTHEQIIDDVLVRPGQRPEFGGQGEGQQKVLGGHLLLQLTFQPLLTLMMLAVRAVAVAAGMWHQFLMLTCRAFDLHHGAGLRAAMFHGRECAVVIRRELIPVLRQEVRLEGVNDGSQADHLTCPQVMEKPSIRPLIRAMA